MISAFIHRWIVWIVAIGLHGLAIGLPISSGFGLSNETSISELQVSLVTKSLPEPLKKAPVTPVKTPIKPIIKKIKATKPVATKQVVPVPVKEASPPIKDIVEEISQAKIEEKQAKKVKIGIPIKSTPAKLIRKIRPRYERFSGEKELCAVYKIEVLKNGRVGRVQLLSSSGKHNLDESAFSYLYKWRFKPSTKNNQAVSSWVIVPVKFEPTS